MANIWENAVITNKGLALQAKTMAGGTISITSVKAGSGTVAVSTLMSQTAVSDIKQTLILQPLQMNDTTAILPVLLSNDTVTTAYDLRQVGFYANDPDEGEILYAIAQSTEARHIPASTEMPGYSLIWNFHFAISNDLSMTATVDPAGYATLADLTNFEENINVKLANGGIPIVTTSGTGAAYTATVPNVDELTVGMKVTIIPHTVSTSKNPTLNINGLGAKQIRLLTTYNTSTTVTATTDSWISANKPITVTYNGEYWIVDFRRPYGPSIYGTVPISQGGTGGTTVSEAKNNLGIVDQADEFSTTKTYAVGDYCIYNNVLYKCINAVTSSGAWSTSNWESTKLCKELSSLFTNMTGYESDSNNRRWWKFPDGTLICTRRLHFEAVNFVSWGNTGLAYNNEMTLGTFPVAFVENPHMTVSILSNTLVLNGNHKEISTTSAGTICGVKANVGTTEVYVEYIAIGRWK